MSEDGFVGIVIDVDFQRPKADAPLPVSRKRTVGPKECYHRASEIDLKLRELRCAACGQKLDALTVLNDLAIGWDAIAWRVEEKQKLLVELTREIEALRRERANLKAQVKRADAKRC